MPMISTLHIVADAVAGALGVCPLCGDDASGGDTGSGTMWILLAGLGAAIVARIVSRKRDAMTRAAPALSASATRGRET